MTLEQQLRGHVKEVRAKDWDDLFIDDLCLDSLFLSVRLNDGQVGIAMNYDLEGHSSLTYQQIDDTRQHLLGLLDDDPLLWQLLSEPTESHAQMALSQAILSALSAPTRCAPRPGLGSG